MEGLHSLEDGGGQITSPDFPIHIFPQQLQQIIRCYCTTLNLNLDYAGVSVLYAFSVALGGHYSLIVKRGWVELPTLFVALVGKPGINKSGPISIFTQPLEKLEKALFKRFLDEYATFKKGRSTKKENGDITGIFEEPVRRQLVIKDATQEAMLKALYENPHGFAGIYDELAAFLKSFNKYKAGGGDEEVMLSLFSGKSISVNRKSSEPIFIEKPFISIIGSIQPQVLINLLGNNKIDNGLTHRFLFAFPDSVIREDLSDDDVPEHIEELYQTFIDRILISEFFHADGYPASKLNLSKDGYEAYKVFRRKINDTINNEKSDAISGIYAKLDTYSLRIALILHVMRIGCNESDINPYQVSAETFCKAAELIEYFEHNALKVFKLMEKFRDPLKDYPMEHKIIYYQLPYSFTTNAAWEIAKEKVSRRTLFNILSDEYLFTKLKRASMKRYGKSLYIIMHYLHYLHYENGKPVHNAQSANSARIFFTIKKYPTMTSQKINCNEAKRMDIVTYLESLSIKPEKVSGNDYWYLSPLRDEKTPSFKINRKLNVWYDHGLGKGGNLIDLGILLHHCSVQELLEKLNTREQFFSFHQQPTPLQNSEEVAEKKIKLIAANSLTDAVLCRYMETRSVPADIAKKYCHQITYLNGEKQFYAIGFKNNSGGFELRSPNFKSTVSPKDFTFLNAQKWEAVAVFEGFIDFLSLVASDKQLLPELTNFLVLNSLSFFEKARPVMEQHERVYLLLDNDAAGKSCAKHALGLSHKYNDLSNRYLQDKDINEWLMKGNKSEQQQVRRSGRRL